MKQSRGMAATSCLAALLLTVLVTMAPAHVYGADFEHLMSIHAQAPSRVAVDGLGTIYLLSIAHGAVQVHDHTGASIGRIAAPGAVSIATGPDDQIYIGKSDGAIHRARADALVPFAASGYPASMAVGPDGMLYVLDLSDARVKVFGADGAPAHSFGGPARFRAPLSLAVSASEIFVLDKGGPLVSGVDTPRVQVFGLDGVFHGSFGSFGLGDGLLLNPVSMAAGPDGTVWLADVTAQVVQAFDAYGSHLMSVYESSVGYQAPMNVAYRDGRLYVISALARRVDVFGIGAGYAVLSASPGDGLRITAQPCAETAPSHITLTNAGPGAADWEAAVDKPWGRLLQTSGVVEGYSSSAVELSVDQAGLAPGVYQATLTMRMTGARLTVPLRLEVKAPSVMSVSPGALDFSVKGSMPPPVQSVVVTLTGDATGGLVWSAMPDSVWLAATPLSGPSNTGSVVEVGVRADMISSMPGGTLVGRIEFTASCPDVAGAALTVAVTHVKQGAIEVNTNTDLAAYTITGPVSMKGTGIHTIFDSLPEGAYTVEFDHVSGFVEPEPYTVQLAPGQTVRVEGEYTDVREYGNIVVCARGATNPWDVLVTILRPDGAVLGSFAATEPMGSFKDQGIARVHQPSCALGDIDGDGAPEVAIGHAAGAVRVYRMDGTPVEGFSFRAFDQAESVYLAMGDLNADGTDEIVAGSGVENGLPAMVRAFAYEGGLPVDTGIRFMAFTKRIGVRVAAGDVDGDGAAEILATRAGTGRRLAEVGIWRVDASGGPGAWEALRAGWFTAGMSQEGARILTADIDADGVDEILLGLIGPASGSNRISAFDARGAVLFGFNWHGSGGFEMGAGDMDFDGQADMAVLHGGGPKDGAVVEVYSHDGVYTGRFRPYVAGAVYGSALAVGQTGGLR